MTTSEFSREFDIIYNNANNLAPGLTEYEKSVFLTDAQEEIIKNHFNEKSNKLGEGYGDSAKRDLDFSNIIKTIRSNNPIADTSLTSYNKINSRSSVFKLDDDVMFIINEFINTEKGSALRETCVVIPIQYDDYVRNSLKPYNQPARRTCWRFLNNATIDNKVVLVSEILPRSGFNINGGTAKYVCRYIKKPAPIVLEALTGGFSINGVTSVSECELNQEIHREILNRAVEKAKAAYDAASVSTLVQLNTRNE